VHTECEAWKTISNRVFLTTICFFPLSRKRAVVEGPFTHAHTSAGVSLGGSRCRRRTLVRNVVCLVSQRNESCIATKYVNTHPPILYVVKLIPKSFSTFYFSRIFLDAHSSLHTERCTHDTTQPHHRPGAHARLLDASPEKHHEVRRSVFRQHRAPPRRP
jgi:hypothetical protein